MTTFLSVEDIEEGANSLAYDSACDNFGLSVECILNSHPIVFYAFKIFVWCIFNSWLYVP